MIEESLPEAHITREKLRHVLSLIKPLLDQADAQWTVFGSAAAFLSGETDTAPKDLDICLSLEGATRAERLLAPYRVERDLPESGKWRSRRSHYMIEGVEIDLSGGLERLTSEGKWMPVTFP